MRIISVLIIWVVLVGGVALYMQRRAKPTPMGAWAREKAKGRYLVDVTPTFTAEKDPFALSLDDEDLGSALMLKMDGKVILQIKDTIRPGERIRIDPIPGLKVGINEFYLEANPSEDVVAQSHAVRVRILHIREGDLIETAETVVDTTIWSEPGVRLVTVFELHLKAEKAKEKTGHAHEH